MPKRPTRRTENQLDRGLKEMGLRIPVDVLARVAARARADRRSQNTEIVWLLERALDALEREGAS